MNKLSVPQHIAIIPDGNRRWAKAHNLPSLEGHRRGANLAIDIARHARASGVKTLTFWALSTENFNRGKMEINFLFRIFDQFLKKNLSNVIGEKTKFVFIGKRDRLSKSMLKKIEDIENETKDFKEYVLNMAIDYGGREEIISAVKKIVTENPKKIDEKTISDYLYTKGQADPDLIIRTGGEQRLSGLMPWQSVYSELYFTDLFWPDFTKEEFDRALLDYSSRQRRFGK